MKKDLGLLGYDAVSLVVFCDVGNHPPKDTTVISQNTSIYRSSDVRTSNLIN